MYECKVGLEAEVLVRDNKGALIMPPYGLDLDDFPVLAEVRGAPGETMPEVVASFHEEYLRAEERLTKGEMLYAAEIATLPLALYRQAMKAARGAKNEIGEGIKNIYGTDISEFSDQIIKNGKIQGANVSCGLHIHFSCLDREIQKQTVPRYNKVSFPQAGDLTLYMRNGLTDNIEAEASASVLTRPAIEYIVRAMDEKFFDRFAPAKDKRTKYRQPGFFELKPYGFEYRSLPFTHNTHMSLPEIVKFAFYLMHNLNKW